ncbi:ergosterol biosynthetic protein 28 homolog [Watersipora subatra]|uniref:ergosterol biosynthetic protein 28 homolog n=1 Tax=Watersipora subatra TaxID=2589382 RepID=UPI00355C8A6D
MEVSMELFLRFWIAIFPIMATTNTYAIYFGDASSFLENSYTGRPGEMTALAARLFGVWTTLASVVRIACSLYLHNKVLYYVAMFTYLIHISHFTSEMLIFKTWNVSMGFKIPVAVSTMTLVWMFIAQWYIEFEEVVVRSKVN